MSRQELRDELMTALVAGHETTASQLAWALERLAREPAVLARLAAELDRGGRTPTSTPRSPRSCGCARCCPTPSRGWSSSRCGSAASSYPPGVVLLASAYLIHHDPTIYPEPYAFRPERFLDASPGTYKWIPFGGGRRRCLGASFALQEMKIVLRAVLRSLRARAPGRAAGDDAPAGHHLQPVAAAPPWCSPSARPYAEPAWRRRWRCLPEVRAGAPRRRGRTRTWTSCARCARFDAYQQSHRWLALPMAVIKKFGDDQGGNLAALVAYYGFFSLFPLLLVFATILGYVLAGDPSTRQLGRALGRSTSSRRSAAALHLDRISGSAVALVIGVLTALWPGWASPTPRRPRSTRCGPCPFKNRANFVKSRLRGLGLLGVLGVMFIVSTVASGVVSAGFGGALAKIAGYVVSLLVNFGLFFAAYRFMTDRNIPSADLRSGSAFAAVLWTILQSRRRPATSSTPPRTGSYGASPW